jgi:hypothetical protein
MWMFLSGPGAFTDLDQADPEVREAVLAAMKPLADNPYDPPGLYAFRMRGQYDADRYVAILPHGWYVTYEPAPNGVIPWAGKIVKIRSVNREPEDGTI